MNKLHLYLPDSKTLSIEKGTRFSEILSSFNESPSKILAVRVNNQVCSLSRYIAADCTVDPILPGTKDGAQVYRRSLCFLLAAAAHHLFPREHLLVGHSLGYGYYYTLGTGSEITSDQILSLKKEMERIVSLDIPIQISQISYKQALNLFDKMGLVETRKQLNHRCQPYITINSMTNFSDMYFGPLVASSGYLKIFDLLKYHEGFLLRFPRSSKPDKLPDFCDIPKLFNVYKKYKSWGKLLNVTSVASLNELITEQKIDDFITITETFQEKSIADIADQIHERGKVKVILIAGPSSSGKTTTSKKLALQLQAIGYRPKLISLDNYYVGRERNPKDKNGNYDFECLEAIDVSLINKNLIELFDGKEIEIPQYDFDNGSRYYNGTTMKLNPCDILIMEGIHGLNDKLTPLIKPELKFKIYVSALTQLNLDDHNRISTSDNRLIRRIVRDAKYRAKTAAETISMWDTVQKGAQKYIFPFQDNADAILNSALDYELSVLRIYAIPLLRCVSPLQKEYSEAARLLGFIENFSPVPPTSVPSHSIIREFIGNSAFHY